MPLVVSSLTASSNGIPMNMFCRQADHGSDVPYQEMGFPTIEAYLRSIPDRIRIVYDKSGKAIVEAIETDEVRYLMNLVKRTKPTNLPENPQAQLTQKPSEKPLQKQFPPGTGNGFPSNLQTSFYEKAPFCVTPSSQESNIPASARNQYSLRGETTSVVQENIATHKLNRETFVEFAKSMVPCYYDILASEVLHYFNADISNVKALCEVLGVNGSTRIVALKIGTNGVLDAKAEGARIRVFLHEQKPIDTASASTRSEPKNAFILPPNAPINYKTMMCRRYQKNQVCWKYCTYAHGFHEMRTIAENQAYRAQQRTKKNTSEIRHPDNENIENDVPIHCADRPYCENSEEEREIRELCEWVEKEVENMEFQEVPYRSLSSSPENILGFDNYAEFLVDTMEKLNISIMALDVPKMLETQFNFNAADYDKYDEELMYFMKGLVDYSKSKLRLKFVNNLAFLTLITDKSPAYSTEGGHFECS
ncbi:hypothetical protein QR680_000070 [Steinernema hermaphroditum]|uniref:C3H1-type domain-containing protein n=1 Tax=Steinernema hermaphroditum TaxID=289476 RepID=A0AA39GT68_9BILA|nr:hypothetical protein QR680_000070 [Steinernema hermaphroditum]